MPSPLYLARSKKGMTQGDVAKELGVSRQAVQAWETGKSPTLDNLRKLSELLEVSIAYLTGEQVMSIDDKGRIISDVPENVNDLVLVPMLDVYGTCGGDADLTGGESLEYVSLDDFTSSSVQLLGIRPEFARSLPGVVSPNRLRLIKCVGDSMEPTIDRDGLVMIDESQTKISGDSIYCFATSGGIFIKRIQRNFDGTLEVMSDNTAYSTKTLDPKTCDHFKIIGRVVLALNVTSL